MLLKKSSVFIAATSHFYTVASQQNVTIFLSVLQKSQWCYIAAMGNHFQPWRRKNLYVLWEIKSVNVVWLQWHLAQNSELFSILHVIPLRYCGKYGQEVGIKMTETSDCLQLCQHQLHVSDTSEWIHFAGGTAPRLAVLFGVLEVIHHTRAKNRATNTLFWEHHFWQCPSILIISWLLCQCSL